MADKTAIEWCDATWNPVVGCSIVSKGCTNCYAMKMAARLEAMGQPIYRGMTAPSKTGPVWTGAVRLNPAVLAKPLSWRRPRRIFVNSMSDLFHESLPDEAIDRVFAVMALCPQHTFQVLTKRPERMRAYMRARDGMGDAALCRAINAIPAALGNRHGALEMPLPNVWLGVSVEDQAAADARIPILLDTPAARRFISAEPLLGPVDLAATVRRCTLAGTIVPDGKTHPLGWVIAGGESGPGARPMHPDWARGLRDQCADAGVPFFFKQWGAWRPSCCSLADRRSLAAVHHNGPVVYSPDITTGDEVLMRRIGKAAAGALLDGREHRDFPR